MPENHSSDEPLVLTEDQTVASLNAIQKLYGAVSFVHDSIKSKSLTIGTRFNGLGCAESEIKRLGSILGSDEDKKQSKQLNENQLRAANIEIRRLQQELSKGVTSESVGYKLKELGDIIYRWWKQLGFSYSKGSFNGNYYNVEFSCYLDMDGGLSEDNEPVSSKKRIQTKIENIAETLDLYQEGSGRDKCVIDNIKNRTWIINAIKERFPGFILYNLESHCKKNNFETYLRGIHGCFPIESIEENE